MIFDAASSGSAALPMTAPVTGHHRAAADWTERRAELRLLERWVPTVFAGRRVLEVGAGTGHWTRFIAPHTQSLLATDAFEHRLEVARARVCSRKASFAPADALRLPEHLGRFDAAFAGFYLSQVPMARQGEFFAGLHARLEPGAKVLLLDHRVPTPGRALLEHDAQGHRWQTRLRGNGRLERVLRNVPCAEDLLQTLGGLVERPVLHQWAFFWALCYELAPAAG